MTLQEELNGIDLANQAPLAALDRGYVYWLSVARQLDLSEDERIIWARTRAFIDPDRVKWNAPGLGNSLDTIERDQRRRYGQIKKALAYHIGS